MNISCDSQGVLRSLAVVVGPTLGLLFLAYQITPGLPQAPILELGLVPMLMAVVVVPPLETLLIIYPTSIASQTIKRPAAIAVVGGAPLALLHLINSWQNALTVSWLFIWSAYCYSRMSLERISLWRKFLFLSSLHAAWNFVVYAIYYLLLYMRDALTS